MSGWNHDNVVRLLARETVYSYAQLEPIVLRLAALGWTPHQARRGVLTAIRAGLSIESLWLVAELTGGDVDRSLDALVSPPQEGAATGWGLDAD
jgi:uncharacterized protein YqfA (UPF0365 family)